MIDPVTSTVQAAIRAKAWDWYQGNLSMEDLVAHADLVGDISDFGSDRITNMLFSIVEFIFEGCRTDRDYNIMAEDPRLMRESAPSEAFTYHQLSEKRNRCVSCHRLLKEDQSVKTLGGRFSEDAMRRGHLGSAIKVRFIHAVC